MLLLLISHCSLQFIYDIYPKEEEILLIEEHVKKLPAGNETLALYHGNLALYHGNLNN